ncbi:MAG: MogA/MoaB family molybdenum cofactor biosynthesis protein, partial [Longimicrobiales bacterium]
SRTDTSGALIAAWASRPGHVLAAHDVVPDDAGAITAALTRLADEAHTDLVVTTGGTGFTVRDVTPEATRAVIERDVPGIAEAMRARGAAGTPYAMLSRGIAGLRGSTLVVNLPGSTGGVRDGLAVLEQVAHHAVQLLRGIDTENHQGNG